MSPTSQYSDHPRPKRWARYSIPRLGLSLPLLAYAVYHRDFDIALSLSGYLFVVATGRFFIPISDLSYGKVRRVLDLAMITIINISYPGQGGHALFLLPVLAETLRTFSVRRLAFGRAILVVSAVLFFSFSGAIDVSQTSQGIVLIPELGDQLGLGALALGIFATYFLISLRHSRKEREYFEALVENAPMGVISVDRRGEIITFNQGAQAILGYSYQEAVTTTIVSMYGGIDQAREMRTKIRSSPGGCLNGYQTTLYNSAGDKVPVTLTAYENFVGDQYVGTTGIFSDRRRLFGIDDLPVKIITHEAKPEHLSEAIKQIARRKLSVLSADLVACSFPVLEHGNMLIFSDEATPGSAEQKAARTILQALVKAIRPNEQGKVDFSIESYCGRSRVLDLASEPRDLLKRETLSTSLNEIEKIEDLVVSGHLLFASLVVGGQFFGSSAVVRFSANDARPKVMPFTLEDSRLFQYLAARTGSSLELIHTRIVHTHALNLFRGSEPDRGSPGAVEAAVDTTAEALGAEASFLRLQKGAALRLAHASGTSLDRNQDNFSNYDIKLGEGPLGTRIAESLRKKEEYFQVADLQHEWASCIYPDLVLRHGFNYGIFVPLKNEGELLGLASFYFSGRRPLLPSEENLIRLFSIFASQKLKSDAIAGAVEEAREHKETLLRQLRAIGSTVDLVRELTSQVSDVTKRSASHPPEVQRVLEHLASPLARQPGVIYAALLAVIDEEPYLAIESESMKVTDSQMAPEQRELVRALVNASLSGDQPTFWTINSGPALEAPQLFHRLAKLATGDTDSAEPSSYAMSVAGAGDGAKAVLFIASDAVDESVVSKEMLDSVGSLVDAALSVVSASLKLPLAESQTLALSFCHEVRNIFQIAAPLAERLYAASISGEEMVAEPSQPEGSDFWTDEKSVPTQQFIRDKLNVLRRILRREVDRFEALVKLTEGSSPLLRKLDLIGVLRDSIAGIAENPSAECIELRTSVSRCSALADRDLLILAIRNLLENSLAAVSDTARPTIVLEVSGEVSTDEDFWQVRVVDNGAGVPEHLQEKIFNSPFFDAEVRGTLKRVHAGLLFARAVFLKHGGSLRLKESRKGHTVFEGSIPRAEGEIIPGERLATEHKADVNAGPKPVTQSIN